MAEVNVASVSIDKYTGAPMVFLREKEGDTKRILIILIGDSEAFAIYNHLADVPETRPMTHSLIKNVMDSLSAKVKAICVNAMEEDTFYAYIKLELDGQEFDVDSRPSDAIALAVRCQAPIYVAEEVIQEHGYVEVEQKHTPERDTKDVLENLGDDALKQYTV